MYNGINQKQKNVNNALVNESSRNNTIISNIPNASTFDKSFTQALTCNSGLAIPVLIQEAYPGDIYEIDTQNIIKLSAQSSTPFNNINYDVNFFYVPYDQLDREFKNLMGENNEYGFNDVNIEFPFLKFDNDFKYTENDLATYFNIPINKNFKDDKFNLYPFLAYGKIWNEWYRDQNVQGSINITSCFNSQRSIKSSTYKSNMSFYESIIYGKGLAPTSKLPSYFTSNLPYQQKGQPVKINLSSFAPVVNNPTNIKNFEELKLYSNKQGGSFNQAKLGINGNNAQEYGWSEPGFINNWYNKAHIDLVADLSNANDTTINDLRYSIVTQHLLENWALCGSRYVEQLKSIWGIEIDPKTINRTELIGGLNNNLEFSNVVQTTPTNNSNDGYLGKIASNLFSGMNLPKISYASSQHGFIIGILTLRTTINNGGQGLPKIFSYRDMLDLFNPMFNGIGEQPTKNKELFYNDVNKEENDKTFGFNEPFLSTKYNLDNASAFMSINSNTSLFSYFLYGEKYTSTPKLSDDWIRYNPNIIKNTLYQVSPGNVEYYHQFICIFYYKVKYTTKQPLFNSPKVFGI